MANQTCKMSREALCPNPNIRTYHFSKEVCTSTIVNLKRPLRDSSKHGLRSAGKIGAQIATELFGIDGITEIFLHPYELTVVKAPLFQWEGRNGIEHQIIQALRRAFGETTVRADWPLTKRHKKATRTEADE